MSILKHLARACVRYGLKPEEIGPISTFTDDDDDYMAKYLGTMAGWETPSYYGCTPKHREWARRAWDKVIAKVEGDAMRKSGNKSARAPKSAQEMKAQRRASVGQPRPIVGEQPAYQEPEDGFDMAPLAPKETGLPFYVYILEDMGVVPDVRVEVAHSARGIRAHQHEIPQAPRNGLESNPAVSFERPGEGAA